MDGLDAKTVVSAFLGAIAIIIIMGWIIYSLIKPDLENLRNIPDKAWFEKVGTALEGVKEVQTSGRYFKEALDDLRQRVLNLEKKN